MMRNKSERRNEGEPKEFAAKTVFPLTSCKDELNSGIVTRFKRIGVEMKGSQELAPKTVHRAKTSIHALCFNQRDCMLARSNTQETTIYTLTTALHHSIFLLLGSTTSRVSVTSFQIATSHGIGIPLPGLPKYGSPVLKPASAIISVNVVFGLPRPPFGGL